MTEFLVGFSYEAVSVEQPGGGGRVRRVVAETLEDVLNDDAYPLIGQSLGILLDGGSLGDPYNPQPDAETCNGRGHKYLFGTSNVTDSRLDYEESPYDSLLYVEASEFDGRSYSFVEMAKWVRKGMQRTEGLSKVDNFLERNVFQNMDKNMSDPFGEVPVNPHTLFTHFGNNTAVTYVEKMHTESLSDLSLPESLMNLLLTATHVWHQALAEEQPHQPVRQRRQS